MKGEKTQDIVQKSKRLEMHLKPLWLYVICQYGA